MSRRPEKATVGVNGAVMVELAELPAGWGELLCTTGLGVAALYVTNAGVWPSLRCVNRVKSLWWAKRRHLWVETG